jgi:hypothetical protein
MKYLFLHASAELPLAGDALAEDARLLGAWLERTMAEGSNLRGSRVRPDSEARTIRVRQGEVLVTDGPFAETREQMAGFDIMECPDLDAALELAAAHPTTRHGVIEVRPFWT